jgi:hypothetical protein
VETGLYAGEEMINCLTAITRPDSYSDRYGLERIKVLLKAQIDNSLELGWKCGYIIVLTNFEFEFMGIKAEQIKFNPLCPTASKMYGVKHLLENIPKKEVIWSHDLDAWQNHWFDCPDFKDVGAGTYNYRKFNGGSVFWRPSGIDLMNEIINTLESEEATYEENVLNRVFKANPDRVTMLNFTYNVGCSNYRQRYRDSEKPVKVLHFHPYNRIAWETQALDRCGMGKKGISDRLESLLRRYYDLATELKENTNAS